MSAPIAPERVLPTLNADGTRRRIRPRLYQGPRLRARRLVAYALTLIFVLLPWLELRGKPLVLLDVVHREFVLFGRTFLATDGALLMLLLLLIFVGIFWLTSVLGRAFCGWACPQTVYMEFVFRPIERWFEGRREDQLRIDRTGFSARRLLKNVVFFGVSFLLANLFLSYFVGAKTLLQWMARSPLEHWSPFVVVGATTALVFFDFAWFREQMCTVACPYARLQSVLLDKSSLVVGYDRLRGEPRAKGKPGPGRGDCIDCGACVVACPTGIDIRDGLQLECIACAQCADACDGIMHKIKKPVGLVRYGTQGALERGESRPRVHARSWVYAALLALLLSGLVVLGRARTSAEVTVLRGIGAPFVEQGGMVSNQIRIKIRNRGSSGMRYSISLANAPTLTLIAPENPLSVAAGAQRTTSVFVSAPENAFANGLRDVVFRISDGSSSQELSYRLLGPTRSANE